MTDSYGRDFDDPEAFNYGLSKGRGDSKRKRRDMGIFDALNQNIRRKDEISYSANEQRKTAKDLAEAYKQKGAFKVSEDISVDPGYQDPGFTLAGVEGRSFGGLIGTGLGAIGGGIIGGPAGAMKGAQFGGSVGSYF